MVPTTLGDIGDYGEKPSPPFHTYRALLNLEVEGPGLGQWYGPGVIKCKSLKITDTGLSPDEVLTLLRVLDSTEKLWAWNAMVSGTSPLPEPTGLGTRQPPLTKLRIDDCLSHICWLILTLEGTHISALHLTCPLENPAVAPTWIREATLTHLSELAMNCSHECLHELAKILPTSLVVTLSIFIVDEDLPPSRSPALTADRLVSLRCGGFHLGNALAVFGALKMPQLIDLSITFHRREPQQPARDVGFGEFHPCLHPHLQRFTLCYNGEKQLPFREIQCLKLMEFTDLYVLDLSHIAFEVETEAAWMDFWSGLRNVLQRLGALYITVPAKYTRLKHCLKHCSELWTLGLAFRAVSPINALRLLGKSNGEMLSSLRALQVSFWDEKGVLSKEMLPID